MMLFYFHFYAYILFIYDTWGECMPSEITGGRYYTFGHTPAEC